MQNVYDYIANQSGETILEQKTCRRCTDIFPFTKEDQETLERISPTLQGSKELIPAPTLCPRCRLIRRLAFRNERKLYRRKCDATGQLKVSMFYPESDFITYDSKYRNSDTWSGEDYTHDVDFSKDFREQFYEFGKRIPKRILSNAISLENCEYSNYGINSKDCYLSAGVAFSEKCHYSYTPIKCTNDIDGYLNMNSQYLYECSESLNCYKCYYSQYALSCKNSRFLFDCTNCENCFGCVNLVGKKYFFFNEQLSPEVYQQKVQAIIGNHRQIEYTKKQFLLFKNKFPKRATRNVNAPFSFGDSIKNAENCQNCFVVMNAQDCKNCFISGEQASNLYDCCQAGAGSSWLYESTGCTRGFKSAFCFGSDPINSYYIERVIDQGASDHLLFCSGIKHKKYHIFNKAYTKDEREKTSKTIIEKMKDAKQRGEFFDIKYSPFPFNDSVAIDYFPVHKIKNTQTGEEQIFDPRGKGIVTILEPEKFISKAIISYGGEDIETTRRTEDIDVVAPSSLPVIQAQDLPNHISEVTDDILEKAIVCEESGRPFRIIKQELDFYREHQISLPRKHYETRHRKRLEYGSGVTLDLHNCDHCNREILSIYPTSSLDQKIYCEECFSKEVYG